MINNEALKALKQNLAECTSLLTEIVSVVNTMETYHNPDKVNWSTVADFGELARELRLVRNFITGKGD